MVNFVPTVSDEKKSKQKRILRHYWFIMCIWYHDDGCNYYNIIIIIIIAISAVWLFRLLISIIKYDPFFKCLSLCLLWTFLDVKDFSSHSMNTTTVLDVCVFVCVCLVCLLMNLFCSVSGFRNYRELRGKKAFDVWMTLGFFFLSFFLIISEFSVKLKLKQLNVGSV